MNERHFHMYDVPTEDVLDGHFDFFEVRMGISPVQISLLAILHIPCLVSVIHTYHIRDVFSSSACQNGRYHDHHLT